MRKLISLLGAAALVLVICGPVMAQNEVSATLLGTGHEERVDGIEGCLNELDFIAGVFDNVAQLQVGGNSFGCDSEWGAFAEFDLANVPENGVILAAVLTLRYTGYGDDAAGLPYVGVFSYAPTGGPFSLLRADLNDQTALTIFAPTSTTNVDFTMDVTDLVADLVADQSFRVGFFISGVFSEAGYNDLVYFGGSSHPQAPRLVVTMDSPIANDQRSWGAVKAVFR